MKPKTKRKPPKPFKKGTKKPANSGRKKGVQNAVTVEVKKAIAMAFEGVGGVAKLTAWAKKNPEAFYTKVWIKLLPLKVAVEGDVNVEHRAKLREIAAKGGLPLLEMLEQMAQPKPPETIDVEVIEKGHES